MAARSDRRADHPDGVAQRRADAEGGARALWAPGRRRARAARPCHRCTGAQAARRPDQAVARLDGGRRTAPAGVSRALRRRRGGDRPDPAPRRAAGAGRGLTRAEGYAGKQWTGDDGRSRPSPRGAWTVQQLLVALASYTGPPRKPAANLVARAKCLTHGAESQPAPTGLRERPPGFGLVRLCGFQSRRRADRGDVLSAERED